jgi:CRISPR-associated endonuclease/helicase Cas3
MTASYFKYWGKAKRDPDQGGADYHLLPYHCLDVAAVADVWLSRSNVLLPQAAQHFGKSQEDARAIILFFILLHDLGKFDARFQNFVESIRIKIQGSEFEVDPEKYSHGSYGYLYFRREFGESDAMKAVAGHHGYCDTSIRFYLPDADEALIELDKKAREEWIEFCLNWLGLSEIPQVKDYPMLAGLCSVADWVGSSITNFTKDPLLDLTSYYQQALPRAEVALLETGMVSKLEGAGFEFLFESYTPRGIQTLLPQIPLEAGLTIVESDTGSGKTEFALAYASLLIQQGLADGIVFGLPTQATANGLFDRIGRAAEKLFPDSAITLAHSKAKYLLPDENGFLHQSSKRAFLGSMSVATVDQVLMGVLGIKHQFVRSFGTRKSVLILDEIHSFDAYMYGLIEQVLKGQHQAYSSVILLSATLSHELKEKLLRPYSGRVMSENYPLISHTNMVNETKEYTLLQSNKKTIQIQSWATSTLLPTDLQKAQLLEWASSGAMIGVVCNTVADAQSLYQSLKNTEHSIKIDLFHARFTFEDRARIESSVLHNYGKNALREGRILVATQVIEQSLDLDFDIMISQIAPIEFLMQRMGRLWRHEREDTELASRTKSVGHPLFITLVPSESVTNWKDHYQGSGFVYKNIRVLYRTVKFLAHKSALEFPGCYREAISYVHHLDAYSDEPVELSKLFDRYVLEQEGSLYVARMNSNLDSKPLNDVDPRCALLTREGEMSATVVILHENGELFHGGDINDQKDRERSTVSIAKKHAKGIKDDDLFYIKSILGKDINYTDLGVVISA